MNSTDHTEHADKDEWHADCTECHTDADAIDWLLAVRKYGIETANRMFPEDQ